MSFVFLIYNMSALLEAYGGENGWPIFYDAKIIKLHFIRAIKAAYFR